jgi:hypothetical protein
MERISRAKNRMRQSRSSGTVGGEGGNLLAYPAIAEAGQKAVIFQLRRRVMTKLVFIHVFGRGRRAFDARG